MNTTRDDVVYQIRRKPFIFIPVVSCGISFNRFHFGRLLSLLFAVSSSLTDFVGAVLRLLCYFSDNVTWISVSPIFCCFVFTLDTYYFIISVTNSVWRMLASYACLSRWNDVLARVQWMCSHNRQDEFCSGFWLYYVRIRSQRYAVRVFAVAVGVVDAFRISEIAHASTAIAVTVTAASVLLLTPALLSKNQISDNRMNSTNSCRKQMMTMMADEKQNGASRLLTRDSQYIRHFVGFQMYDIVWLYYTILFCQNETLFIIAIHNINSNIFHTHTPHTTVKLLFSVLLLASRWSQLAHVSRTKYITRMKSEKSNESKKYTRSLTTSRTHRIKVEAIFIRKQIILDDHCVNITTRHVVAVPSHSYHYSTRAVI